MPKQQKIYFASDIHLGMSPPEDSLKRERLFIEWLEEVRQDAREIWLLGDVFDYWFEYRKVVPRGFVRFQAKLAELQEAGIDIHLFTGNHDVWMFDYLPSTLGVQVHHGLLEQEWNGKHFLLGHGDGLLRRERSYRMLQRMFRNPFLQWCYARIHPNASIAFAQRWSRNSRNKKGAFLPYLGKEKEYQVLFAREQISSSPKINYFVFGHRHIPYDIRITDTSRVICLGDWIYNFSYAVFDGKDLQLKRYLPDRGHIIIEE